MAKKKIRVKRKKGKRKIRVVRKPARKRKIKITRKPKRKIVVKRKPKKVIKVKRKKKRSKIKIKPKKKVPITLVWEWIVIGYAGLDYSGQQNHRYDIVATGRFRDEAIEAARELIAKDINSRMAADAIFTKVAKVKTTNEEPGLAEWRTPK